MSRRGERAGFSLLQILLVMLLVGILCGPIINAFLEGTFRIGRSEAVHEITIAGMGVLDRIDRMETLVRLRGRSVPLPAPEAPGAVLPEDLVSRFGCQATLEVRPAEGFLDPATGSAERDLYRIVLTLTWRERRGRFVTRLATLRANTEQARFL